MVGLESFVKCKAFFCNVLSLLLMCCTGCALESGALPVFLLSRGVGVVDLFSPAEKLVVPALFLREEIGGGPFRDCRGVESGRFQACGAGRATL